MAILVEAKAMANRDATATATAEANDSGGKNTTAANHGDGHPVIADIDDEDDELFELDIARLDGGLSDGHHSRRSTAVVVAAAAAAADAGGHALLSNCLLPARSVSKAVLVDASSALSSSYYPYYSGYCSSRRFIFTGGGIGRRFLFGRSSAAGNSSRLFSFSSRGFETYFQRY